MHTRKQPGQTMMNVSDIVSRELSEHLVSIFKQFNK